MFCYDEDKFSSLACCYQKTGFTMGCRLMMKGGNGSLFQRKQVIAQTHSFIGQ